MFARQRIAKVPALVVWVERSMFAIEGFGLQFEVQGVVPGMVCTEVGRRKNK